MAMVYRKNMPNFVLEIKLKEHLSMKSLKQIENQDYITFNDENLIIVDKIQNLPDNVTYYSEHILIFLCTEGKMQIEYDGKTFTVHKREIFLAMPGSVLSDYMISPNFDAKVLSIKPTEVMGSQEMHNRILNSMIYVKDHPVAPLTEEDNEVIFSYYNLICNRIKMRTHNYRDGAVRSLLNAFLLEVVGMMSRNMDAAEDTASFHGDQLVMQFVKLVNEAQGSKRSVEHFASQLNITPKYLSTLVRSSLDRTPSDVIRMVTMKEIERRLRYSEESIKQISNAMNFPNTSFFGKYFKQHAGMSPNSYRKKYHK